MIPTHLSPGRSDTIARVSRAARPRIHPRAPCRHVPGGLGLRTAQQVYQRERTKPGHSSWSCHPRCLHRRPLSHAARDSATFFRVPVIEDVALRFRLERARVASQCASMVLSRESALSRPTGPVIRCRRAGYQLDGRRTSPSTSTPRCVVSARADFGDAVGPPRQRIQVAAIPSPASWALFHCLTQRRRDLVPSGPATAGLPRITYPGLAVSFIAEVGLASSAPQSRV